MTERFGLAPALFSLKAFAAAMLAIFIAFSIGLDRPYWAFLTAYIVAQPLAGAVISKALFRVVGTFVGAAAAVIMVPPLDNSPELLTLAIALWLGGCVFVSLLDRTPRSYMFVLAGYSACLIVLPSVETPGAIFTVASLRVEEITLGILCGSLIHGIILPGSVAGFLLGRVETILRDAEQWSRDLTAIEPRAGLDAERRRLAQDVSELHQLSIHLPFETNRLAPRVRTVRALQDQLSQLLPLGAAVEDRLNGLRADTRTVPTALVSLIADVHGWLGDIGTQDRADREACAGALQARCSALEPVIGPEANWHDLIVLSLVARLSAMIAVHRDCRDLADQMTTPTRKPVSVRAAELLEGRRNRELHRDYAGAFRGAVGAFLTMVIGSALWIASGWQEGSTAVMLAGVFLALFSASEDPLVPLKAFLVGTMIATLLGALYGYVIMPQIDGFPLLMAVMAPPLLVLGAMMATPRFAGIALPTLLGLGSPALIANHYQSAFGPFVNGAIAQFVGIAFAITMARLLQAAGVEAAIRRTIGAGWLDIARRSELTTPPDLRGWINRMLDRVALLAPRLALQGARDGAPLYDALRDLRTGVAIGELRQLRIDLPADDEAPLAAVLHDVGRYYRHLDPAAPGPAPSSMLADIDRAIALYLGQGDPAIRRAAALGLVSLRRNLFPDEGHYQRMAA